MEEIIKVQKEDGIYDCSANVTVDEWKQVLQDTNIATDKVIRILQLYYNEPNHASTSENLRSKYGGTRQSYFVPFTGFCDAVQQKLNRFRVKDTHEKDTYYIIAVTGKYVANRHFEYTLRPELVQAIEELDLIEDIVREDFVETRSDVIKNLKTLYSYASSTSIDESEYAIQRYKQGKWYIVEVIDGKLFFAPSRFAGYKDNTIEKHTENHGNGNHTNDVLVRKLKLYKPITEKDSTPEYERLSAMLNTFLSEFDVAKSKVRFLCPVDFEMMKIEKNMKYSKYTNLLLTNKNIVLTGAPGTGKSYLAKRIAEDITKDGGEIGFVQFHPSYDYTDFVEGLRAEEVESGGVTFTLKNGIFKEFCKKAIARQEVGRSFDELYDDFVTNQIEGLELFTPTYKRPIKFKINSRKSFEIYSEKTSWVIKKDLIRGYVIEGKVSDWKPYTMAIGDKFKELYAAELNKPTSSVNPNKYVFIIDEINRGEISKIFGELFYSIDPGYRGVEGKVKTQYQNLHSYETDTIFDPELGEGWFYVPDNVYIIGTMNDIDRSVESMDFAMRRRFTWVEIDAESRANMLDDNVWSEEAVEKMFAINSEIEKIEGLGRAYHVGPAYFLKLKSYQDDTATMWDRLWEYHIEPLIKEYLRGMPSAETSLNKFKSAYYGEGEY